MERLKELEEKRRQLKELRERRKQASLFPGSEMMRHHPTGVHAKATMVSVSVQTEMEEGSKIREPQTAHIRRKEVITYDKGIQTDQIEENKPEEKENLMTSDASAAVDEGNNDKNENTQPRLELAKPFLIEDATATLNNASFARLETLVPASAEQASSEMQQDGDNLMKWTMVGENVQSEADCDRIAQEYDPEKGILVVVYLQLPPVDRQYASGEAAWSVVNVVKCDNANGRNGLLVDMVEFRGTRIMRATILRRNHPDSKIVSILLTTFTGKIILYELRLKQKRQETPAAYVVQRNLVARHYFQHPVVAVIETSSVQGQEKVLVAADNGNIMELSCLDLTVLRKPQQLRPVPLSQLLSLEKDNCTYTERLQRLAKFDEVGIASVAYTWEDPQYIWVGGEDGCIYKVVWDQPGPLYLALNNNGFQPAESHSTRVTGLEFYRDDARRLMLLLSCSTDWTVRLWDARAGKSVIGGPLLLGAPVLRARWLEYNEGKNSHTLRCEVWCADGRHVVVNWAFDSKTSLYTAAVIS
ncbi:dynein intermediate chain [Saccharomyces paradoxus]|uniref:Dynein intermediate chain n=1 Tax=Saccharomyces paradoxus TaxID=27291 RepID=A0A8B8UPL3_SACPA|nr:Pac11 [Saccharomyces paradoxus]QHS72666.1 Pac11 [Saccharomyces paradoxus]